MFDRRRRLCKPYLQNKSFKQNQGWRDTVSLHFCLAGKEATMPTKQSYETHVVFNLPDGQRIRKHLRGKSPEELEQKKQALQEEIDRGIQILHDDHFQTWSKQWLETTKLDQGLSEGQELNYTTEVRNLNRMIGNLAFQQLTLYRLQSAFNRFARCNPHTGKPTSASTLRKYRSTAVSIARFASASGVRGVNVSAFEAVQIPRNAPVHKRTALTPEQIDWVEHTEHEMQPFAMIATFAGLRRGEVLGLQWRDLDLERATLHVRRTLLFVKGSSVLKEGGKTDNAVRTVCLPPVLVNYLKQYRAQLPVYPAPNCFVTVNKQGRFFHESTFKRYWEDYIKTLNRLYGGFDQTTINPEDPLPIKIEPFTPHQCRHTFATLLYLEHIGVADSMSLMGHSDPKMTLSVYTDLRNFNRAELPEAFRQKLETIYRIDVNGQPLPAQKALY